VSHDVVEFLSDAHPLSCHRAVGQQLLLAMKAFGAFPQTLDDPASRADVQSGRHGGGAGCSASDRVAGQAPVVAGHAAAREGARNDRHHSRADAGCHGRPPGCMSGDRVENRHHRQQQRAVVGQHGLDGDGEEQRNDWLPSSEQDRHQRSRGEEHDGRVVVASGIGDQRTDNRYGEGEGDEAVATPHEKRLLAPRAGQGHC